MDRPVCDCACRAIDDFEAAAAAALEPHGLGQDLIGYILPHASLLDRFQDLRSAVLQALSCKASHEASVLLQKFDVWGNAKEMLLLFSLCLQHENDTSASCILPFLGDLHQPSTLLYEACKFGRCAIAEQIVRSFADVSCVRHNGLFSIGCDCFQSTLLSKASESDKVKIVNLLCNECTGIQPQLLKSAFNTALRLRQKLVCDALLVYDVTCVCSLSVADAVALCSEHPLSILISNLESLGMSPPELYEVACTAVTACHCRSTVFLLLQTLLSMGVEDCSHGTVKEWDLLRLAVCSCNMAAISVIDSWAAAGGDAKLDASVLNSLVSAGKGEQTRDTLQWLLATHSNCFSQLDILHAAEAAAFNCNLQLVTLLLPHMPASSQAHNLRVVCEQQQQQQPAALMWFALQGVN
jgi:hypothetical protein